MTDQKKHTPAQRKEQFKHMLDAQDGLTVGEKLGRSAWEVTTPTRPKAIWFHFNVYFHMWSGTYNAAENIAGGRELIHVFLGPRRTQFYVVPDDDLHTEFTLYDQNEDAGWLLNAAGSAAKTKVNARQLQQYQELTPLTG